MNLHICPLSYLSAVHLGRVVLGRRRRRWFGSPAFWAPAGAKCFGFVFFQHAGVYSPAYCRFIKSE